MHQKGYTKQISQRQGLCFPRPLRGAKRPKIFPSEAPQNLNFVPKIYPARVPCSMKWSQIFPELRKNFRAHTVAGKLPEHSESLSNIQPAAHILCFSFFL